MTDVTSLYAPTLEGAVRNAEMRGDAPALPGRGAGGPLAELYAQQKLLQDVARAGVATRIDEPDLGWMYSARPR